MDSRSSRDSRSAQPALAASKRHEQASSNEEEHLLSFIHLRPQTLGASLIPCKHSSTPPPKKGKNAKYIKIQVSNANYSHHPIHPIHPIELMPTKRPSWDFTNGTHHEVKQTSILPPNHQNTSNHIQSYSLSSYP